MARARISSVQLFIIHVHCCVPVLLIIASLIVCAISALKQSTMTSLQQQQARSRVLSGGSSLHTRSVSTSSLLYDENARSKASVLNTGKSVAAVTGKPRVVLGDLTNAAAAAGNADKQIKVTANRLTFRACTFCCILLLTSLHAD